MQLPMDVRTRILLRAGLNKIPMMRYIRPKLIELSDARAVVKVNLSRRTKNMYGSMYLGALAVGADCVTGFYPAKFMFETGHRVPPIIKSARANYYKRVKSYVLFTCTQGKELTELCHQVVSRGDRLESSVRIIATAPMEFGQDPVAEFTHILSLKNLV